MTGKRASRAGKAPTAGALGRAIMARLDELAALSDEPGRLTRLYLSPAHARAVDLVTGWMRAAGMTAAPDAVGNVIGRYESEPPGAPALLLGSHIDTVRDAGRFDGALGVVAAIAIVAHLALTGRRLPFAIEVAAFGDEEGVRFASTLGGSRALAGVFAAACLDERDRDGISRGEALAAFGCDAAGIAALARRPGDLIGYVEIHIEQGPVLESERLAVGIVTAINGATRGVIEVAGVSGHAGTVPMGLRRDALAAAAEIVLAIEALAKATPDLVATVGQLEVPGGAVNTVAGQVRLTLDMRSPSDVTRAAAAVLVREIVARIATARGVEARVSLGYDAPATPCDGRLSDALAASVAALGHSPRRLASGAGHDGMAFRGRVPVAMLFVRCLGGISHNPAEFAAAPDIDLAARVVLDCLGRLGAAP